MCWLLVMVVAVSSPALVRAHGRLMEPPARNSMWRLVTVRVDFIHLSIYLFKVRVYINKDKCL